MQKRIEVSDEELINFIQEQPDNRVVKMNEPNTSDPCGCLLVQYSREKAGVGSGGCAGYSSVTGGESKENLFEIEFCRLADRLVGKLLHRGEINYKEIKSALQYELNSGLSTEEN